MDNSTTNLQPAGLSLFTLKLIVMAAMLCDHIGALFFPDLLVLHCIGRLAFPVYCFLIANGFFHTHSKSVYLARLIGLACLSQIPFTLMQIRESDQPLSYLLRHPDYVFATLNTLFVLSLGLIALLCLDRLRQWHKTGGHLLGLCVAGGVTCLSYYIHCEFCFLGVPLIVAYYEAALFRRSRLCSGPIIGALAQIILSTAALGLYVLLRLTISRQAVEITLIYGTCQFCALLLVFLYNGTKGKQSQAVKYCFYLFYPAHILALVVLHTILT